MYSPEHGPGAEEWSNDLQKRDVPEWITSRDPAREEAFPQICAARRLLRRRILIFYMAMKRVERPPKIWRYPMRDNHNKKTEIEKPLRQDFESKLQDSVQDQFDSTRDQREEQLSDQLEEAIRSAFEETLPDSIELELENSRDEREERLADEIEIQLREEFENRLEWVDEEA